MGKIRVLIADDNIRSAGLMEEAIKKDKDIEVIGKAEDGMDALEQIRDKEPDVVLLDLIMPKLDGLGVMEHVKKDITLFPRLGHIAPPWKFDGRERIHQEISK